MTTTFRRRHSIAPLSNQQASQFQEVEVQFGRGLQLVARLLAPERGLLPVQSQALQAFVVASMLEH